jgi:hypothetical protein
MLKEALHGPCDDASVRGKELRRGWLGALSSIPGRRSFFCPKHEPACYLLIEPLRTILGSAESGGHNVAETAHMCDPYALTIYIDGSAYRNPGREGGFAGVAEFTDNLNREYTDITATEFNSMAIHDTRSS